MPVVIELPAHHEQLAFNRRRWVELCSEPAYADRPEKFETNRFGEIVMTPPPLKSHGRYQHRIAKFLDELLPEGFVTTECPVSTSDGVKGADVTWASKEREARNPAELYDFAPEICVEVRSPSNTDAQLAEKRALYFDAGAEEVWVCELNGTMCFFLKSHPEQAAGDSSLCPRFPKSISLD